MKAIGRRRAVGFVWFSLTILLLVAPCRGNDERRGSPDQQCVEPSAFAFYADNGKVGFKDAVGSIVIERRLDDVRPALGEQGPDGYRRIAHSVDIVGLSESEVESRKLAGIGPALTSSEVWTAAPVYQCVNDFHEGLAPVKVGSKWGFVDWTGQLAIRPAFDEVGRFSEGFAAARAGHLWGYIDWQGQWAIRPRFAQAGPFVHGFAKVERGTFYTIDRRGYKVRTFLDSLPEWPNPRLTPRQDFPEILERN